MTQENSEQLAVRVSKATADKIRRRAEREQRTVANVLRMILDEA